MSTDHRDHADLPPPRLEEVADGAFAYVQPDGSWGLNNTGILVGADAATLIDTCFTERRNRALLDAVATLTDHPARTLVNTHHHGDHTHGNWLVPAATIIGHELCREEMLATGTATAALFPGVDFGEIRVVPPFVTFADRLTVWVDEREVQLLFLGPAHTTNDVVAWLPAERLLFTGDLVFNQCTPFVMMGSVAGSLAAVARLRALEPVTVVPGHGPVGGPESFDAVESYLRFVDGLAREAFEAGASPLDTARQADLGPFADWPDQERLAGNLHRAFSELRGEPLGTRIDLGAAMADMVEWNGGQLPRCLA